ncbi:MAG: ABC transporter ATP-binding protein, partial [Arachnia sp.]
VLELRFPVDDQKRHVEAVTALVDRVEELPDRLLLYTHDGDGALTRVHERGIAPLSALVRRATLEEVFLHLTGRRLID